MKKEIPKILLLFLFFLITNSMYAQYRQAGNNIDGDADYDRSGNAVSLNGNRMAIGTESGNNNEGYVRIYEWDGTDWVQMGQDINGGGSWHYLGSSVSLDGDYVAIGAWDNSHVSRAGYVQVYKWNGVAWVQMGQDIDGESGGDRSGWSVSLGGNRVAIGAPNNENGGALFAGHVRVYEWNGVAWVQMGQDIDGNYTNLQFGNTVSLDGNRVAIGVGGGGAIKVYEWNGTAWGQLGSSINWVNGQAISLEGNRIAIGSPDNNNINGTNAGRVRVYEWDGSIWGQLGQDMYGKAANGYLGTAVSLDGNNLAAGAPAPLNGQGYVQIYKWNGIAWTQYGADIHESGGGRFGASVSLDGNKLGIGAPFYNANGSDKGRVSAYFIKGIFGSTYRDYNQNCIEDSLELGLISQSLIINPGNIIVQTNANGVWYLDSLSAGTYTITADTTQSNWQLTCPTTQAFTITNPDSLMMGPSFGFVANNPCPSPNVSIHAPFLRPGFSNQKIYVQGCNNYTGSDRMDSVYVIVELDSLLTIDSGSLTYIPLGNNQYQIYLADSLYPGECINFWLNTTLSTNAVLGQTLCMNATLYPINSCALDTIPSNAPIGISSCNTAYDGSHLIIRPTCNNDSIDFVIINAGDADMTCYSQVRLYIDGQYILMDSIQLTSGNAATFVYSGDGRTWRMEVDQHPLHPGNSQPSATIELCGNTANWTSDLVNILPQNDADPVVDIYCGLVTGSYDPNDKTGYPLGMGNAHEIPQNQEIEYLIRFQNTGIDTAFTVVIRDTLLTDFNIFSVQSGVSSHPYTFRMYGPRVLEWTFSGIMLPDSNVNELASHGFVKFKVNQNLNLPISTLIENSAAIYFDYNTPIITNSYFHTIATPQVPSWANTDSISTVVCDSFTFNGLNYLNSGHYFQSTNNGALDSLYYIDLTVIESSTTTLNETNCSSYTALDGQVYTTSGQYTAIIPNSAGCDSIITINLTIDSMPDDSISINGYTLTAISGGFTYQWIDCDNGNVLISGATNQSFIPTANGNYAVEINNGSCSVVSDCINITGLMNTKLDADFGVKVFPNPVTNILNIEKDGNDIIDVTLVDNLGRKLFSQRMDESILKLNLNGFSEGIYYLFVNNGKQIGLQKIIKK